MQITAKVLLLLFVLLETQSSFCQTTQTVSTSSYAGSYLPKPANANPFPEFVQLEILETDGQPYGRVYFWGDKRDSPVICNLQQLHITNDSLSFTTHTCLGERYQFVGHWVLSPRQFQREGEPIVVSGSMIHFVHGKSKKSEKVSFSYRVGC